MSGDKTGKSEDELETMRQVPDERRRTGNRALIALVSAVVFGALGAVCAWWQLGPGLGVVLAGVGGAILGFASWYIPDLIPRA
jgi:hypothetical protein